MTDQEKIEKLLNHIVKFADAFECEAHFANEERWDNRYDDEWCEEHCKYSSPQKECFRHYLLGE